MTSSYNIEMDGNKIEQFLKNIINTRNQNVRDSLLLGELNIRRVNSDSYLNTDFLREDVIMPNGLIINNMMKEVNIRQSMDKKKKIVYILV